jgi:hypothetical protein
MRTDLEAPEKKLLKIICYLEKIYMFVQEKKKVHKEQISKEVPYKKELKVPCAIIQLERPKMVSI